MINLLLCGNEKVFDGALTELISITNKTKEPINCYILTMEVTRIKKEYTAIKDEQIDFLNKVVKTKNADNKITKIDVTDLYEKEFGKCKNENAYCTPYTLLRLFIDLIPNMPEKILYLDIDMMIADDINKLYSINIDDYEYAAVREKYGCIIIRTDYINAGMLLLNMSKIKETKLLEKARNLLRKRKMLFADQDAIYWSTSKKLLLPRIFNEQSKFNKKDTVICHFCKRLMLKPYPHTENYKQWQVDEIHKYLKCYAFDKDLEEYLQLKKEYEEKKNSKLYQAAMEVITRANWEAIKEAKPSMCEALKELMAEEFQELEEQVTERVTEQVTEQVTERVTERVTEQVTEQVTERVTEQLVKNLYENVGNAEKVAEMLKLPIETVRRIL